MTFFGNAPELIIGAAALHAHQGAIVKASIAGSILSNAMLVVGCVFLIGGWRREHIPFNRLATATSVTQLAIAVLGLLIPAAFVLSGGADAQPATVTHLSLAVSVVLVTCYVVAQVFALRTHRHLFAAASASDEEEIEHAWGWRQATAVLLGSTLAIGVLAEALIDDGLPTVISNLGWSDTFVGVVVVAVIGNAAELAAAVGAARHGKLDLAVRVGIEGASQVALLLGPVLVLLGSLLGTPIDLAFPGLLVLAVTAAVFILHLVASDGEGTWLEGVQLLGAYLILAVAFFMHA
jgi:Ca2+:H+ antiporter